MPTELTDRPDAAGGKQSNGKLHRSGQHAPKPLGGFGPTAIINRDGVKCPLRLHDHVKFARQPPDNGGGRPAA
jgi:hypothetical protein